MSFDSLSAFLVAATLLTMAPGLDTAMVLRVAATDGSRQGAFTALGIAIGCLCWGAATAFGLGALIEAWPLAFEVLRWVGALYLAWFGTRLLLNPRRAIAIVETRPLPSTAVALGSVGRGFATNILNPKVGLFYLTLLPQFVPESGKGSDAFMLACIHVVIALVWFVAVAVLTGGIRPLLRRPGTVRLLDRVTGGIFVLLALQLGLSSALDA
jgi:threonine/homoserine/homoserine lactone efflux protein